MAKKRDSFLRATTLVAVASAAIGLATGWPAAWSPAAADDGGQAGAVGHGHHARWMHRTGYERSEHDYAPPDVVLTNQDGQPVKLSAVLSGSKPVILSFIFTTCTTICPVLSATLAQTRRSLGPEAQSVEMISITIDPDHDTPARLRDYARRLGAGDGWQLLTGEREDILAVQRAFDAHRGDKMNHIPLTFLHFPRQGPWVRLEGFTSAAELVREYRRETRG